MGIANKVIKHKGLVKSICGKSMIISIINLSACASCHVNGACSVADVSEKEVEISSFRGNYESGQEVSVIFRESLGFKALFFGYVFPFLLVLFTLVLFFSITDNEVISGISALGILLPYYLMLYFNRRKLKNIFIIELEEEGLV